MVWLSISSRWSRYQLHQHGGLPTETHWREQATLRSTAASNPNLDGYFDGRTGVDVVVAHTARLQLLPPDSASTCRVTSNFLVSGRYVQPIPAKDANGIVLGSSSSMLKLLKGKDRRAMSCLTRSSSADTGIPLPSVIGTRWAPRHDEFIVRSLAGCKRFINREL